MGTRDLPNIYAQALGPAALGLGHIYIRQIPNAHVIANIYHFRHPKNLPKPEGNYSAVTDADFDSGRLFKHFYNVSQYFCDLSDSSRFSYEIV